jgi:hypothetical protein
MPGGGTTEPRYEPERISVEKISERRDEPMRMQNSGLSVPPRAPGSAPPTPESAPPPVPEPSTSAIRASGPDGVTANRYRLRRAADSDAPALTKIYDASVSRCHIYLARDEAYWIYLIRDAGHPVWIAEDRANGNKPVGFLVYDRPEKSTIRIIESCGFGFMESLSIMRMLKKDFQGAFHIGGPPWGAMSGLSRSFGGIPSQPEQWLLRITDVPALLTKIAPALEKRLAASDCAGVTAEITVNMYKTAYRLAFAEGKLKSVEDVGFRDYSMGADGGDLCIPRDAFVRLVFGFRRLDRLMDAWPDIVIGQSIRYLIDTLFPEVSAYIHTPYHYLK